MNDKTGNILGLVPARSGSKGVPGKNIRMVGGHPLIAYSIAASLQTPSISRTVVTTDSEEIAQIALDYGAEVPFIRPAKIATDDAQDMSYVRHALNWLASEQNWHPDLVLQLRPVVSHSYGA